MHHTLWEQDLPGGALPTGVPAGSDTLQVPAVSSGLAGLLLIADHTACCLGFGQQPAAAFTLFWNACLALLIVNRQPSPRTSHLWHCQQAAMAISQNLS